MKDLRPEGSVYPLWKNPSSRLQWEFPDVPLDWTLLDIHDSSFIDGLLNDVEYIDLTWVECYFETVQVWVDIIVFKTLVKDIL